MSIGLLGYGAAALAWGALAVPLSIRGRGSAPGRWLLAATFIQFAWACSLLALMVGRDLPHGGAVLLEALRPLGWSLFLIVLLRERTSLRTTLAGASVATAIAAIHLGAALVDPGSATRFIFGLLAAVLVLLYVEQVYRNTDEGLRWAIKFLCLALASLAAFDVVLYADALLFMQTDPAWWAARGFAHAAVVPLVAISAARTTEWRLGIRLSRKIVFHSATLVASGAFLLAVSVIGYGLRLFGGEWAGVAQTLVMFAAVVTLSALAASANLRAKLRVWVSKHFFTYRYDYRAEWLRLTELLAAPERLDEPETSLTMRSLGGLAALVESPGGALWLRTDSGTFSCQARIRVGEREAISENEPIVRFLADRGWIIDLPEWRANPGRYGDLVLPHWLVSDPEAWLVVPLSLQGRLIGFVQLQRSVAPVTLDWEVRDILRASGTQIAGYLAVRQAVERLVQTRQFDSFNRMSAFVVHDLKNLVAQLTLLLKNAQRHRDNPAFQQDMLETVENVLARMQGLLMQLRVGTRPIEPAAPIPLVDALRSALAAKKGLPLDPSLDIPPDLSDVTVVAHRDRLERVVGHLVQNAVEATPIGGSVRVVGRLDGAHALVEVIDTGRGMSKAFVETRLFRPFTSNKEHGMGIGAFESHEYIREIGGSLHVSSIEGSGTTFTIRLPIHDSSRRPSRNS